MAARVSAQPHVLREYAVLADGYRGAVCGPRGGIAWMCAPLWHDDAVFSTLLGGAGQYVVEPVDPFVWGGWYEPRSLIWRDRWVTTSTIVECRETLARPGDRDRAVLLRRIEAIGGAAKVRVELDVRAGFGEHPARELARDDAGRWTMSSGDLRVRWSGAAGSVVGDDGVLRLEIAVPAGEHHDLVLDISRAPLGDPVDPVRAWRDTEATWNREIPEFSDLVAPRDAQHAYAVLRGLTMPGGGMAAAATMSLPERAAQGRNYDYRYTWIRDQCYAGIAAATAGAVGILDDAVSFTTARLLADGDQLRPAYTVDGREVPGEQLLPLTGYPGGQTVIRGNWATSQFQLDSFGEALQLFAEAARLHRLDAEGHRALQVAVSAVAHRWQQPEAGMWELHDDWWTHSRLACVAGLRATARVDPRTSDVAAKLSLADAILAETSRRCLHRNGYWQRSPSITGTDAALLLPPVRGALARDDPRIAATLEAVRDELTEDGYVYRFRQSARPLGEDEGAFLLCGFIMAIAEHHRGNDITAFRLFERNRAACGPPGLYSEEYDVGQRQLRGNLPQAFVHALLIEASARLRDPSPGH